MKDDFVAAVAPNRTHFKQINLVRALIKSSSIPQFAAGYNYNHRMLTTNRPYDV